MDDEEEEEEEEADAGVFVESPSRFSLMYSYANKYPIPPGIAAITLGAIPLKNPLTPSCFAINFAMAHQPFFNCSACS